MEEAQKKDSKIREEFKSLLKEDLKTRAFKEQTIIKATVLSVNKRFVVLDTGLKSSSSLPLEEFRVTQMMDKATPGATISVYLEKLENNFGESVVSLEKAKRFVAWNTIKKKFQKKETIDGVVVSRIKGGFILDCEGVLTFLPGSQVSQRKLNSSESILNKKLTVDIVKMDNVRKNIVVSAKSVLDKISEKERGIIIKDIKVGSVLKDCVLKSITSWGAFFTYKSLDILVHVNEVSWSRVGSISDVLSVGETHDIYIFKIENGKLSGSLKRLQPDLFEETLKKYKVGDIIKEATVQSLKEYGAFVEVAPGVTGLVHSSECDHLNKSILPSKVLSASMKIPVKIIAISLEDRKLSLSYKACFQSPWISFKNKYKTGSIVNCKIKNTNSYAIYAFIEDTPIIGMLHSSNLVWEGNGEEELKKYHKNNNIKCQIYSIDEDKFKVQLSLKHALGPNPYDYFADKFNSIITVTCGSMIKEGLYVYCGNEKKIKVLINKNQLGTNFSRFSPNTKIDCMVTQYKPEKNFVTLSLTAADKAMEAENIKKYGKEKLGTGAVLGDILGPILKRKKKPKDNK